MHESSSDALQLIEKGLGKHHLPGALYDAQPSEAGCMEGTRVQLLDDTKRLLEVRGGAHIVWIAGMAGTGKTSIALTLCRALAKDSTILLGGTFFCSRSTGTVECTDVQRIVPTFAVVLARRVPAYAKALVKELDDDPDLAHKSIRVQVERLISKPLNSLGLLDRQIVFVVDALDECSDGEKLVELINALAGFTSPTPVKFLVTSRPEMHIRQTPIVDSSLSSIVQLHTIDPVHVTADIRLYFQTTFEKAPSSSAWYTKDDLDELATLSGGLFIFAATALAYILKRIDAPGRSERLQTVKMQTSSSTLVTAPLDKMYSLILMQASDPGSFELTELVETRRIIAAILSTRAPLTLKCLAELLGLSSEHLRGALDGLHAVILVPEEDDTGELRALHVSFADFIFTRAPENIRIRTRLGHDELARGCLERMSANDLCFNISRITTSYKANPYTKPNWIATSLVYASLNWAHHINLATVRFSFDSQIDFVLRRKLLFWLELLSVLGEVGRGSALLRMAASAVAAEDVFRFLRDAILFVASSHEAITRSAPHIYLSALPFAPKDSLVRRIFSSLFIGVPSIETFGVTSNGGRCVMVLAGHGQVITGVTYSPDGKVLASSSHDTVRLWDTHSGLERRKPLASVDGEIKSIAFTPDCRHLIAGTRAGSMLRWDIRTGRLLHRGHIASIWIRAVAVSPDGGTIAFTFYHSTIGLWSTEAGQHISTLPTEQDGPVDVFTLSPDGKTLAFSLRDETIRLWDYRMSQPVGQPLKGHRGTLCSMVFSRDGLLMASGSSGGEVNVWDILTGRHVCTYPGHQSSVSSVAFAPDGHTLASASYDHTVRIWDLRDGGNPTSPRVLRGHSGDVNAICFSNDGLNVASCSLDCTIRVWEVGESYYSILPLDAHASPVNAVVVSSYSQSIFPASGGGSVRVWGAATQEQVYSPLYSHTESVRPVAFSSKSLWIATGSSDMKVRLLDVRTGQLTQSELCGRNLPVNSLAISSDSLHSASGSYDNTIHIWDTGIEQSAQISPISRVHSALFVDYTLDGQLIAACSRWDAKTGRVRDLDTTRSYAFSSDKRFLVTGSTDTTIRLWNVEKVTALAAQRERNALAALAFAEYKGDGWLVSPTNDLLLWVPHECRGYLEISDICAVLAQTRAIITTEGGVLYQGEQWTRCWRADNSSNL